MDGPANFTEARRSQILAATDEELQLVIDVVLEREAQAGQRLTPAQLREILIRGWR